MHSRLLSLAAFSLTAFAVTFLPPATAGDLYKWTDEKGQVHYTSTPPPDSAKKAKTLDTKALSKINALPNDLSKDRADGSGPTDDSDTSEPETPTKAASTNESTPTSPPALIPASLLPPSNTPAMAKPEQPAQPEIVEVVAQGMGIDANAALLNAYSNAVQQALGLYVDAETMVQNDQIVRDKILTYSKGFIQEASEISKSQANGLFQVNIRAKVKRQQLLEQAKANNISVKAVEGVSLHAKVMSQIKQEQDANALLEKALLPFAGTTLLHADLVGEPKIISRDQTNVKLAYTIKIYIDKKAYRQSINELISILDKTSLSKKEFLIKYKIDSKKTEFGTSKGQTISPDILRGQDPMADREPSYIQMVTQIAQDLSYSKWLRYTLPKDFISEGLWGKLKSYQDINIELGLLAENNDLIESGIVEIKLSHHMFDSSPGDARSTYIIPPGFKLYTIRPYFDSYGYYDIFPELESNINITIAQQDLLRVKTAKLEIKPTVEK